MVKIIRETLIRRSIFVYEAARIEAIHSERPIVPEPWDLRDLAFREQFIKTVERITTPGYKTTPEKEHQSWVRAYKKMGWQYGLVIDTVEKIHPDMVPFNKLEKKEQEKDVIFLALCRLAKRFIR